MAHLETSCTARLGHPSKCVGGVDLPKKTVKTKLVKVDQVGKFGDDGLHQRV